MFDLSRIRFCKFPQRGAAIRSAKAHRGSRQNTRSEIERQAVASLLLLAQLAMVFAFQAGGHWLFVVSGVVPATWLPLQSKHISRFAHTTLLSVAGVGFVAIGCIRLAATGSVSGLFELFAHYLLMVQAFELLRDRSDLDNNYFPGLAALSAALLLMSVEVRIDSVTLAWSYVAITLGVFLLLRTDLFGLLFSRGLNRRKGFVLAALVAFSLVSGTLVQSEMAQALPRLRQLVTGVWNRPGQASTRASQEAQFVREVGLSTIAEYQKNDPNALVFSVYAAHPPGYMRTLTFDRFTGERWNNRTYASENSRLLNGVLWKDLSNFPESLYAIERPRHYRLAAPPQDPEYLTVEVLEGAGSLCPLPIGVTGVVGQPARERRIVLDRHQNVKAGEIETRQYGALAGPQMRLSRKREYLMSLLDIPEAENAYLVDLAHELFQDCRSDQERIRTLVDFFGIEFKYSLESNLLESLNGRTPLQAFLSDRRSAHCEYFATAAALLLRVSGIPTRLSTGYLIYEMNESADFYVGTRGKAHAWVEAFDRDSFEWTLVEATPGIREYVQQFESPTQQAGSQESQRGEDDFWDSASGLLSRFQEFWRGRWIPRGAWWLLSLTTLLVCAALWWRNRVKRFGGWLHFYSAPILKADQHAARLGLRREPHETCHEFALRLGELSEGRGDELAAWYRKFAEQRYSDTHQPLPKLTRKGSSKAAQEGRTKA